MEIGQNIMTKKQIQRLARHALQHVEQNNIHEEYPHYYDAWYAGPKNHFIKRHKETIKWLKS